MEDGDGIHRADVNNQSEAIFSNHLIVSEILASSSVHDLRSWRLVNKIFNAMTCEFLNLRQNPVGKFEESEAITTFLDTMDERLEHKVPYSAYELVLVSRMSSEVLGRFGTDLVNQIRKLNITLLEPTPDGDLSLEEATDWSNGKAKTLQLLSSFPNIAELHLQYNEDHEGTFLNAEDVDTLPQIFPFLEIFQFTQTPIDEVNNNGPIPLTFVTEISKRAPRLKRIDLTLNSFSSHLSPSLWSLPAILSGFSSPPVLSPDLQFQLYGDGVTDFPTHLIFLRDLRARGLNQLYNLEIALESPSPGVMAEFNEYLEFQAHALRTLHIYVFGPVDPSLTDPLTLPLLPNLKRFQLQLLNWPLTQIRPNPLTIRNFPAFTYFKFEETVDRLRWPNCAMSYSGYRSSLFPRN